MKKTTTARRAPQGRISHLNIAFRPTPHPLAELDSRLARAIAPVLENLEQRRLLAANQTWVNDNWTLVQDNGEPGLSVGDVVDARLDNITFSAIYGQTAFGRVTHKANPDNPNEAPTELEGVQSLEGAATINDAIANTNSGGTVRVWKGSYEEQVIVDKDVQVRGQQFDVPVTSRQNTEGAIYTSDETIIRPGSGQSAFVIEHSGATVNGFMIDGQGEGSRGVDEAGGWDNTKVLNNFIGGFTGLGVALSYGSGAEVKGNQITDVYAGIYLAAGGTDAVVSGNRVFGLAKQPPADDAGAAIVVEGDNAGANIINNALWGNRVGLYIWNFGDDFEDAEFGGNTVAGNISAGNTIGIATIGGPLLLRNNRIIPSPEYGTGIYAYGSAELNLGPDNEIQGGKTGILLDGAVTITGNTLNNLAFTGNLAEGGEFIHITPGTLAGVRIDATSVSFAGETGAQRDRHENFALEDQITHALDSGNTGFVHVKSEEVFVTQASGSIQRGINAAALAETVETVHVAGGAYNESPIINRSLTLQGSGRDQTTINLLQPGTTGTAYLAPLRITGADNDVTIDGFTINGNDAIGNGLANSNISLGKGLGTVVISNNRLNVGGAGPGSSGDDAIGIINDYDGATLTGSVKIIGNEINATSSTSKRAFAINTGVNELLVDSNQINGDFNAVSLTSALDGTISNNVYTGDADTPADQRVGGLASWGYPTADHGKTVFEDNTITNTLYGISVYYSNNTIISDNTLENNTWALDIRDAAGSAFNPSTVTISGNTLTGSTYYAYYRNAQEPTDEIALGGNTFDGVLLNDSTELDDVFAIEARIIDRVDVSSAGLLRLQTGKVFVSENSYFEPSTTAASIQRGVDAAVAGDTVHVAGGAYVGQVSIDKNLKLIGAGDGASDTVITAPEALSTDSRYTFSFLNNSGSGYVTGQSIITVKDAEVEIRDLRVDGMGRGNAVVPGNDFLGIGAQDASLTIENVTVTGVRDAALAGNQRGRAIFIDSTNPTAENTASISNVYVSDYQKSGIYIRGAEAYISDSTIIGAGPTDKIAQNGITFEGAGARGSVTGSTIQNHAYTGPQDGTGVLVYNAGEVEVVDNPGITSNDAGIRATGSTSRVKIQGNNLTGNVIGIGASGAAVVDAGSGEIDPDTLPGSTGGNILTGYTGLNGNYAVQNLNLADQPPVYARNNQFGGNAGAAVIEQVLFDDTDDPTRGPVLYEPTSDHQESQGAVWVDDDWAGLPLGAEINVDTDPDTEGVQPAVYGVNAFATLGDALDAVEAGGTVHIAAGVYNERITITKANVTLIGSGIADLAAVEDITSENAASVIGQDGPAITIAAHGVKVEGLVLSAPGHVALAANGDLQDIEISGNYIHSSARGVDAGQQVNLTIANNVFDGFENTAAPNDGIALTVGNANGASITGNTFRNVDWRSIYLAHGGQNITISGNDIVGGRFGIIATATVYGMPTGLTGPLGLPVVFDTVTISNNTITGVTTAIDIDSDAIEIGGQPVLAASQNIAIEGNTLLTTGSAVVLFAAQDVTVGQTDPNTITVTAEDGAQEAGIVVLVSKSVALGGNTVNATGDATAAVAAEHVENLSFVGGSYTGGAYGIAVKDDVDPDIDAAISLANQGGAELPDFDFAAVTLSGVIAQSENGVAVELSGNEGLGAAPSSIAGSTLTGAIALRIDNVGSAITLSSNTLGGTTLHIDNQSANDINAVGTTFSGSENNFRIEDRIFHKMDDLSKGLVTWVAGNVYVTAPDTDSAVSNDSDIQRAIDAIDAGIVNIEAGTYEQSVNLNKTLTLVGSGRESTTITCTITLAAAGSTSGRMILKDLGVVLPDDYVGTGSVANAIVIDASAGDTAPVTLDNVRGQSAQTDGNTQEAGLYIYTGANTVDDVKIVNSAFEKSGMYGLLIHGAGGELTNLLIEDSSFDDNGYKPTGIRGQGISDAGGAAISHVTIRRSSFSNNEQKGIYLESLSDALLEDLTITDSGSGTDFGPSGIDLNLKYGDYQNITLQNVTITNSGTGTASSAGVAIKARNDGAYASNPATLTNVTLENVIVTGSSVGISIGNAVSDVTFDGVEINGTSRGLVFYTTGSTPIDIGDTTFGAGLSTFIENSSASPVDATGATFGTYSKDVPADNFRIEDKVIHKIDQPTFGLVTWVADNVYVTTPGSGSTDSSIQSGINAAEAGWTVNVEGGAYTGGINVNKAGLVLLGHGLPTVGLANFHGAQTGIGVSAPGVTVEGFKIDGTGFAGMKHGIYLLSTADGTTVRGNTIVGVNDGIVSVYASSDGSAGNTIDFNTITGVTGAGIRLQGNGGGSTIDANIISGSGAGIVLDREQNTVIERNTLTANGDGIGMDGDTSGTVIRNNFIHDSTTYGIFINSGTGPQSIYENSIVGNGTGLQNNTGNSLAVGSNWWGSSTGPSGPVNSNPNANGDAVSGPAHVAPWLISGDDIQEDVPGFQPNATSFAPITNSDTPTESYSTIQAAIDGTEEGGEIYIQTGGEAVVFAENLVLNKQVKLIAMDGGVVGGSVSVTSITLNAGSAGVAGQGVFSADVTVNAGAAIQDGISLAAAGGTVTVAAGTYTGPITIDKSLTLEGAKVNVASTDSDRGTGETILDFSGLQAGLVVNADNVTVDGFEIVGDSATIFGVWVRGNGVDVRSGVTLTNNIIHGMAAKQSQTDPARPYAFGILVDNKDGTISTVSGLTITDNHVYDIGSATTPGSAMSILDIAGGLTVGGTGATITGNRISNIATVGANVGVGVYVPGGSAVEVSDNIYDNVAVASLMGATGSSFAQGSSGTFSGVAAYFVNAARTAGGTTVSLNEPYAKSDQLAGWADADGYFSSIQLAVDSSATTGLTTAPVVTLTDDTFNENVIIDRALTLSGVSGTTISPTTGAGITITYDGAENGLIVQVSDLAVVGAGTGIVVEGDYAQLSDLDVSNNTANGILVDADHVEISDSTINNNADDGLVALAGTTGLTLTNVTANNNGTSQPITTGSGILLNGSTGAVLNNVTAQGNWRAGVTFSATFGAPISQATVTGGSFTGNGFNGITPNGHPGAGNGINIYAGNAAISDITIDGADVSANLLGGIVLYAEPAASVSAVDIGQETAVTAEGNGGVGLWISGPVSAVNVRGIFTRGATTGAGVLITGTDAAGSNSPVDVSISGSTFTGYASTTPAITLATGDLDPGTPGIQGLISKNNVSAKGNSYSTAGDPGTYVTGNTAAELDTIEDLIVHKPDSNENLGAVDLGLADYTDLGNLAVSVEDLGDNADNDETTIDEGESIRLTGSFTNEPKAHKVTIDWGDGSQDTLNLAAGVFDFACEHTYADDPQGATERYTITVVVAEDVEDPESVQNNEVQVKVSNIAPQNLSITPALGNVYQEGQTLEFTASATDPGDDTLTHTWRVLKNNVEYTTGSGPDISFVPDDNATYGIELTVADEDGGQNTYTYPDFVVDNVPPTITSFTVPTTAHEGDVVEVSATATDPGGASDPLTYTWTVTRDSEVFASGTGADWSFTPDDNGDYVVTLVVSDKDGGTDTQSETVVVSNVAPTVAITGAPAVSVPEGTPVSLGSIVSDAGSADTLTYAWTVEASNGQVVAQGTGNTFEFTPFDNEQQGLDPATYTVTLTVTDDDGGTASDSIEFSVTDTPPVVPLAGAETLNENQVYTLTIGPITDLGDNDRESISVVRVDWHGDGFSSIEHGDYQLSEAELVQLRNGGTVALEHLFNDGAGNLNTIRVTVANEDSAFTYDKQFVLNNLNPTAANFTAAPATVPAGTPGFVSFSSPSDPSPVDAAQLRYAFDFDNDGIWDKGGDSWLTSASSTDPFADVPASFLMTPGVKTVKGVIYDKDGGSSVFTTTITVEAVSFRVLSVTPNNSGFDVTFSQAVDPSTLNLYAGPNTADKTADVRLVGPQGEVAGSFVLNADHTGGTFIATGGVLPAGNYTLTLQSGADAFKAAADGELLDGNTNGIGTPGGDHVTSFTINASGTERVVSVPDFARGPGQSVNVPGDATTGLPITINNAQGVTGVRFNVRFDPALLDISAIVRAQATIDAGWSIQINDTAKAQGLIEVTLSGANALTATSATALVQIQATVNDVAYGASQVIRLEDLQVFAGAAQLPARADAGIHKVMYLGDVSGNKAFTGDDVSLISRVDVNLDSGFDAALLVDPRVLADINGDGDVNAGDAGLLASEALYQLNPVAFEAYDQALIPNIPAGVMPSETPGVDPTLSIPMNLLGAPGSVVNVPLHLEVEPDANVTGFSAWVAYDATKLDITGADITLDTTDFTGWDVTKAVNSGVIGLIFSRVEPVTNQAGNLVNMAFTVKPDAAEGQTVLDLGGPDTDGGLTYTHIDGSILIDKAPQVVDIAVAGSAWSSAFVNYLGANGYDPNGLGGFSLVYSADQPDALPWTNINTIKVKFSEDVQVTQESLDLLFTGSGNYVISGFTYDNVTHVATWTLNTSIGANRLLIALDDATIEDLAGNSLDGEWTDGNIGPSGDGAAGGDFHFRFNVLPGDVNGDGVVLSGDALAVRAAMPSDPSQAAYNPYADVDGNGVILSTDFNAVRARLVSSLPTEHPGSAEQLFSASTIETEDESDLLLLSNPLVMN